jgi:hypothetical protein
MHSYSLFDNDAWLYVFMMAFGFTNGYFGSLCMMYGPRYVLFRTPVEHGCLFSELLSAACLTILFVATKRVPCQNAHIVSCRSLLRCVRGFLCFFSVVDPSESELASVIMVCIRFTMTTSECIKRSSCTCFLQLKSWLLARAIPSVCMLV